MKIKRKKIKLNDELILTLNVNYYAYGGGLAIQLYDGADLWADLTINLTGMLKPDINYAFLTGDLYTTNGKKLIKKLKDKGIINESQGLIQYNMGRYELVGFDMEKLREYDPIGVSNYLEDMPEEELNKKDFNIRFYDYNDVVDLVKNKHKLIVVCSDNLELMVKYEDLADFIIDYNYNVCNRKIECYDYFDTMYQPFLITYGDDIDYCVDSMKDDFNQRLEKAKKEKDKDMNYKVIDPDSFNKAYEELDIGIKI